MKFPQIVCFSININSCPGGEIGRHAGLRSQCESVTVRVRPRAPNNMNVETFNTIKETFTSYYDKNYWGYGSGHGSLADNTLSYRNILVSVIKDNNIKTVLDYGCGDWQFSKLIDWDNLVDSYLGVDVASNVINQNQIYVTDKIKFESVTHEWLFPKVDLIICKDVLQHLPDSVVGELLTKMKESSKFMLITNDIPLNENVECDIGGYKEINILQDPWNIQGIMYDSLIELKGVVNKRPILVKNI